MLRQWTKLSHTLPGLFVMLAVLLVGACKPATGASSGQTPSPTVVSLAQLTVYGTSDTGTLRALRADTGQMRWQAQTDTISGGKPVVDNGIVYAGSNRTVYAFKSSDGTLLWSAPIGQAERGPLEVDGVVYGNSSVSDAAGNQTISVLALRGSDGTQLWKTQVGSAPFGFPGLLGEYVIAGVVYVAVAESAAPTGPMQFFVYAYHAADGSLLWRSQVTHPDSGAKIGLAVDEKAVYAYVDRVYAYNRSDGTLLWSSQPGGASLGSAPDSLSVQQGIVYVDAAEGVSAYRASDGSLLWSFAQKGQTITVANGVVYTTAQRTQKPQVLDGAIVALDGKTGRQLWRYEPAPPAQPAQPESFFPLLVGDGLVFGVKNQGMVALDAATGKLRWQTPTGGNGNAPVLVGNTLFVGAYGATSWGYTALNASDGRQLWTTPITEGITFPSALTVAP